MCLQRTSKGDIIHPILFKNRATLPRNSTPSAAQYIRTVMRMHRYSVEPRTAVAARSQDPGRTTNREYNEIQM